ncbi:hypothetical protein KBI33_02520 [Candidatus Shapirobacteria bacterium]|nr:hypothetical protein [Candidatus Shapirobacteria bacterium]
MGEKKKIEINQFWSGFGLGVLMGGALAYFLEGKEIKKEKILKIIHQLSAEDFDQLSSQGEKVFPLSSQDLASTGDRSSKAGKSRVFKRNNKPLK